MPEEPLSPEREALLAITMATGDAVDVAVRILGVLEQMNECHGALSRQLRSIDVQLRDVTQVLSQIARSK